MIGQPQPAHPDRRSAARSQLIRMLAEHLVRNAIAQQQQPPHDDDDGLARDPVRALQHGQAARNLDR